MRLRGVLRYDFEESIGYWIAMANHAMVRTFQDRLAPFDITYRQAQVLGWLALEGPLTQSELAARMLIEPPSLVGVLDRMEEADLIERRPCDQDRRRKMVHTRPAARRVWSQIAKCAREIRAQATEGLTREEVATLKRLLRKVRENASAHESLASR